jgi:hypothetical protein
LSLKQVVLVCHYNVTFVTMMKSKICYKPFWNLWKSRCTVEQCCRKFHFATERLSANAFDTVIDIVLKDLKLYSLFGKHWIDTKQTSSTILILWLPMPLQVLLCCYHRQVLAMTRSLAVEWGKYEFVLMR